MDLYNLICYITSTVSSFVFFRNGNTDKEKLDKRERDRWSESDQKLRESVHDTYVRTNSKVHADVKGGGVSNGASLWSCVFLSWVSLLSLLFIFFPFLVFPTTTQFVSIFVPSCTRGLCLTSHLHWHHTHGLHTVTFFFFLFAFLNDRSPFNHLSDYPYCLFLD